MKILTLSTIPDELAHAWLQHLRDFDVAHPGCHFEVAASSPDMTLADMIEAARLDPAFDSLHVIWDRAP